MRNAFCATYYDCYKEKGIQTMFDKSILEDNVVQKAVEKIKEYYKVPYCTLVSSGTAALEVALKALELPRGSKVIIPDISFIATATAVANVGLIPVYGDCTKKAWGITIDEVQGLYQKYEDVKACIVVHFSGIVNRDIDKIAKFCSEKKIFLLEDCAQVFGASHNNTRCGIFGDIGTFSFQTSKVITCGEGGMVISKDTNIANRIQAISDWGLDLHGERQLALPCGNLRMNQLAACFLLQELERADEILKERVDTYNKFLELLKAKGVEIQFTAEQGEFKDIPFFMLVKTTEKPEHVLHPIGEYPMHQSELVRSIIQIQYPDLLDEYDRIIREQDYSECTALVEETNFVPMYGVTVDNVEEIVRRIVEKDSVK